MKNKLIEFQRELKNKRDELQKQATFCREHKFEFEFKVKMDNATMLSDLLMKFEMKFDLEYLS